MNGRSLTPENFSAAVESITASFGDPTRREIYWRVRESEAGLTASDVAKTMGLHNNVARHHLDKLAAAGHLVVDIQRALTAGRPSKRYRSAKSEVTFDFPARHDDLLGTLLGRSLALLPPEDAERLAEEVGHEYGLHLAAEMAPGDAHRSLQSAVTTVAETLTSHGFVAHTEGSGGQLRIVSEHCPFGQAAIDHPVLCAIDRGLVRGMLAGLHGETAPQLAGSLAMGDSACTTLV
ncbi:MAG: helix-turn-helix domain-containing protein [Acidimicrobiales bacterium]|nr:helix-turn-helix domain-containing protein [Acidimicrobiales bacterium]